MQAPTLPSSQLPFSSITFVEHIGGTLHGQVFAGRIRETLVAVTRLNPYFSAGNSSSMAEPQFPELTLYLYDLFLISNLCLLTII